MCGCHMPTCTVTFTRHWRSCGFSQSLRRSSSTWSTSYLTSDIACHIVSVDNFITTPALWFNRLMKDWLSYVFGKIKNKWNFIKLHVYIKQKHMITSIDLRKPQIRDLIWPELWNLGLDLRLSHYYLTSRLKVQVETRLGYICYTQAFLPSVIFTVTQSANLKNDCS